MTESTSIAPRALPGRLWGRVQVGGSSIYVSAAFRNGAKLPFLPLVVGLTSLYEPRGYACSSSLLDGLATLDRLCVNNHTLMLAISVFGPIE